MKTTFKEYLFEKLELLPASDINAVLRTKAWNDVFLKVKQYAAKDSISSGEQNVLMNATYDVLTQVPEMEDALSKLYGDDLVGSAEYKQHNNEYKAIVAKIESYVKQSKDWKVENSGAWCHFVRAGERSESSKTDKWYATLKERDVDSIKVVASIIYEIAKIQNAGEIQVKIPSSYGAFIKHVDSIVVHYHDPAVKTEIQKIAGKFRQHFADRARMLRTEFGTDDKAHGDKGSDSMIVAKKFAETVNKNHKVFAKYFNEKDDAEISKILLSVLNQIAQNASHRQ